MINDKENPETGNSGPPVTGETRAKREQFTVLVRGREQPQSTAVPFVGDSPREAFERALAQGTLAPEPIMYWHSADDIVAIDIDYHTPHKPAPERFRDLDKQIEPAPRHYWRTHGGGLRLIYFRDDVNGFTALDHALLAMLKVPLLFADATGIEIKTDTRHPKFPRTDGSLAGDVNESVLRIDPTRCLSRLLGTGRAVDEHKIEEWLEEHGYQIGKRLSHAECPIDPTPNDAKNDCVSCLDGGVYCFRCDATGVAYPGCSKPGFVPWSRLIEEDASPARFNRLRAMATHFCHWEHAKYVIQYHTGLTGKHAEQLYRMLLRRRHLNRDQKDAAREGHEKLIGRCFFPKVPIVRADGYWAHPDDLSTPYGERGIGKVVASLPAVCYVDPESGEVKQDKLKAGLFEANGDLSEYGYPPLEPVRGADIARLVPCSDSNERRKGVPALVPADPPFRYHSRAAREQCPFDWREHIRKRFPGVNLDLLKLLIAAKGFAQRSMSEPPRVLVTGQSGGGKTAHVLLAATMTGDSVGKLPIDQDPEKFIRNYATEAKRNGFVFSDEVAKSKLTPTDMCNRLLQVSRETTFHQLYVGSTRVGRLAVHVMADTLVPRAMRAEVQLARRIVHVDLGAGVNGGERDWRMEGDIDEWLKTHHDAGRNRTAAHMLVSEVMDDIRLEGWPYNWETFEDYARRLGFPLLRDAADGVDEDEPFRELFRQVITAPDSRKGKWKGEGWKVLSLDDCQSSLSKAFQECLEGGTEGDYQAITGRQWGRLFDIPGLVCDVSPHRRQVGIRFRVGEPRSSVVRYNRDVLPENHPLREPDDASVLPFPAEQPGAAHTQPLVGTTDSGR